LLITDIAQQKNNAKRYSVFIDGEFKFGINEIDLLYYKLKTDEEISQDKYDLILNELILQKAKDKALNFLGYRIRSIKEIEDKLKNDFSAEVIEKVMEFLAEYNYIDDEKFSLSFIKDKMNLKKDGPNKIKSGLYEKGINREVIDKIFSYYDFGEEELISELLEKKSTRNAKISDKEKSKLFNYLVRKGFSYDEIKTGINEFFSEE